MSPLECYGRHGGVPAHIYHAWPGLGSTPIRIAADQSVAHALAAAAKPATAPMRLGSVIHSGVLEPETLETEWVVEPEPVQCRGLDGKRCSRNSVPGATHCWQHGGKEEAAEWRESLGEGVEVIDRAMMDTAREASDAIRAAILRSEYARLLEGGAREVSLIAAVKELSPAYVLDIDRPFDADDLIVRGRVDLLHSRLAVDLKGVSNPAALSPRRWSWRLGDYGMLIQAALYLDLLEVATGEEYAWAWIGYEMAPPYAVRIYEPHPEDVESARDDIQVALDRWHGFRKTGDPWIGWPKGRETIRRPKRWTDLEEV